MSVTFNEISTKLASKNPIVIMQKKHKYFKLLLYRR